MRTLLAKAVLMFTLALGLMTPTANAQPVLSYAPPPNTYRSASAGAVDDYTFNNFNASVQVYQFRPFDGDIRQAFQSTLLRNWLLPAHQEENVGAPPTFQQFQVPGAQYALIANFGENIAGTLKPHFRILIVAEGQAAIFDASANGMQAWQQAAPVINAMIGTFRVQAARTPPALTQADGRAIAGLYRGYKTKYTATSINITGSPTYVTAQHFYLFSANGRIYRAYDELDVPGGRVDLFDFEAAERADPQNSGRYTVDGGKLLIQTPGDAMIVTDPPRNGRVRIDSVLYERQ